MTSGLGTIAVLQRERARVRVTSSFPPPGSAWGAPEAGARGQRSTVEAEPDLWFAEGRTPALCASTAHLPVTKDGCSSVTRTVTFMAGPTGSAPRGREQLCLPTRHSLPAGPQQGPPEFSGGGGACPDLGTLQAPGPTRPSSWGHFFFFWCSR